MAGIYIHIPFCKQACHYCDFHFSTNTGKLGEMVDSICAELVIQKDFFAGGEKVKTLYFGGGTPSLMGKGDLEKILDTVYCNFDTDLEEITIETNPDDLNKNKLGNLKDLGFDRLSIGIQSFNEDILRYYNRAHSARESLDSILLAKKAGFKKLSMDLMFGFPYENHGIWKKDLKKAIELDPGHISSYCLTIEAGTTLGKWEKSGKFLPAQEDFVAEQFEMMQEEMEKTGYLQYEISNFGRPDCFGIHNSNYWKGVPYLGIGPSAHSFDGKNRQHNIANNPLYIKAIHSGEKFFEKDELDSVELLNEYLLTSLRTIWGVDIEKTRTRFQVDLLDEKHREIKIFVESGLLETANKTLKLTKKGRLLADGIAEKLFL